jgi:tetratricopeptide (TPR) repeat protein
MNMRPNNTALAALGVALMALAISPAGRAQQQSTPQQSQQQQQQSQQQQQQSAKPADQGQNPTLNPSQPPAGTPKVDPEEEKAYKAFADLKPDDYDQEIQQGEDFAKKYPDSRYSEFIYSRLTNAYYGKQEFDKMYASSDKALALDPNDVTVLILVGWVIPHNYDPNDVEADRRLTKAETYEKHALDVLPTLPKPANLTDEQFAAAKSKEEATAHSGLGLIYFREQKAQDSLKELQQATAGDQSDPVDFFIMGIDLKSMKRFTDAADAFQKCAQIPGAMQDRCKTQADQAKAQAAQAPSPK